MRFGALDLIAAGALIATGAVTVAACGSDPTLSVTVTHPSTLTNVAKTVVTVYESDTLHCEDVEFARLDAGGLAALAVDEADLSTSGTLGGISRLGTKVIVARGYDATGALVSAGCTEHGEVKGADSVAISTLIAAIVSIRQQADASVIVALTDANGTALADARPVTWTTYGFAGSTAANPSNVAATSDGVWEPKLPSCTTGGFVTIHPNPPSTLGGYAVQIRAAWAVVQPQPYTSLANSGFAQVSLGGSFVLSTTAKRYCAIQIQGTTDKLICVDDNSTAHQYTVTSALGVVSAKEDITAAGVPMMPAGQKVVAVIAVPAATGTDRNVYSVTDHAVIVPLFGAPAISSTYCGLLACVNDAIVAPPCGTTNNAKILMAAPGLQLAVKVVDVMTGPKADVMLGGATVHLDNAGCATQLQSAGVPILQQLVTLQTAGASANNVNLLVGCTATGVCAVVPNTPLTHNAGVGFTTGSEPRMVATTVDASGVVLVEVVFSPMNAAIERARLPTISIPTRIVVGQIDKDTGPDLFWDVGTRTTTETSFEIAYARTIGTANLEALSPTLTVDVNDLATGDLTNDGLDDILVTTTGGVRIVPMGDALPVPAANTDATCMP